MAAAGDGLNLKEMLQSAVKSVQWTYIIFWKLCHQQRVLVWGDGYYNGAIKTRKTVQAVEVSTEEAALSRSDQLKELYESLASGEMQVTENHRPSGSLTPEDLTASEWFYLMCVSFSFPPGVGLVGDAYAKQQHLWLKGANEADSKVFSRTILAKSAYIQTVVCFPLLNGVIELGTTDKVEETDEFIRHVKLFFTMGNDNPIILPPKPALSAHSSNTILSSHQISNTIKPSDNEYSMDEDVDNEEDDDDDDDEDDDEQVEEDAGDDEVEDIGDNEDENGPNFIKEKHHISSFQECHQNNSGMVAPMETNELLQVGMFSDIKFGSPNDGSNNFDSHFNFLATSLDDSYVAASTTPGWSDNFEFQNPSNIQLHTSEKLAPEDTRYSHTVSTILHNQHTRWSNSSHQNNSVYSTQSTFTTWTSKPQQQSRRRLPANSQRLLKYIIFTVPFLHSNNNGDTSESVIPKAMSHEELSVSHVMAERRRREKLNERFIILRTLVPLVTKMDKASILGDTIEYVKQLRKKIQDLEAQRRSDKRKVRGSDGGVAAEVEVEVSIIENDALVEVQCAYREGLLLDLMKKLRDLGVEITTVQSCVDAGLFSAEMRAKVKMRKTNNGKKISIMQVKKAIDQIISMTSN